MSDTWPLDHQANVYSQAGEDGVTLKLLERLPQRDRWCVEFGAWDGLHLSNTRNLIEHHGYSAVLIEGDPTKFARLERNYAANARVVPVNGFVGFDDATGLDRILRSTPIPAGFDFLSIDIDGNDYHVWRAVRDYRPKLVCIEFNPTIPTEVKFVQPADRAVTQGASLASLVELGKQKGYELVAALRWNAYFVRAELFPLFGIANNTAASLRADTSDVTHLFVGFDGTLFLAGARRMPWHSMPISEARIQQLPGFLRRLPNNYGILRRVAFRAYRAAASLLHG